MMSTDMDIDDSLYSRQRYMLGDTAMKRLAQSSVLLIGVGGLGIEIAKNIVLAGVKSLTLLDDQICTTYDLGSQFFIREADVAGHLTRSAASAPRLAELNPNVSVAVTTGSVDDILSNDDLSAFQCVIVTEMQLDVAIRVDTYCRNQQPPIKFISGDVHGLLATAFCDFGDEFIVLDQSGEEVKKSFIGHITKSSPGVVTTFDKVLHGLETGDWVTFREVVGMSALNQQKHQVTVLSPTSYSIGDTTGDVYGLYLYGGIATQLQRPRTVHFRSLEDEVVNPTLLAPDLCKIEAHPNLHLAYLTIKKLTPSSDCNVGVDEFIKIANSLNLAQRNKLETIDHTLLRLVAHTYGGCLPALCAVLGGILAQECLKSITGKFTPLSQWLHLDCTDLIKGTITSDVLPVFGRRNDRYDCIRQCIGHHLLDKLAAVKLFLVGCGAIGCEMLKNLALLGVGTSGLVTITDNDLIEKSNLNRQFLFRPHHIRLPKSTTAATSTREINKDMCIKAHQHKVCSDTEASVYDDRFFESLDACVNALDNVEARRYMDTRCVTNERPLLDTGTMGSKGHVQVIVPHLSESYTTQNDPVDEDIPYCTLKSFPATIEHCIQWARDKFESSFVHKPSQYNKFFSSYQDLAFVIQQLRNDNHVDGAAQVARILPNKPTDWPACLRIARLKFEKYFNHRAKQLLHSFPLDSKLSDNVTLFWQSPKRPPTPVEFDIANPLHLQFIVAAARLYADMDALPYVDHEMTMEYIKNVLKTVSVPEFQPSNKTIEISAEAKKPEVESSSDGLMQAGDALASFIRERGQPALTSLMNVTIFEKDCDENGHIDFISAAANLRAAMYSIDTCDRLTVKRIAGRIIPAIATTTATIAGFATIELMKIVNGCGLDDYRNCFLNLALPVVLLTQPGAAVREIVKEGVTYTQWDKWHVRGNANFTLTDFIKHFQDLYELDISLVVQGVKMVYVPAMPLHHKRLSHTMVKLLRPTPHQEYTDLVISFAGDAEDDDDLPAPPVRYHFGL